MFRPCWLIFRENLGLRTVQDTSQTEDESKGTFSLNCISASNNVTDYPT
jgi:hypothetical protein